jgi:putative ABC transport system permease protein
MRSGAKIPRQKEPSFALAFSQAWKSLQVRRLRHLSAGLGIFLAMGLYGSVRASVLLHSEGGADMDWVTQEKMNWLVFLSLLICFVGVTHSMVLSVTERYREIGTLKCLGATDSFIVKVFFCEAILLGFIASSAGGLLGLPVLMVIKALSQNLPPLGEFLGAWGVAFGEAVALGMVLSVLAAIFPAFQASKLPPAMALRVDI